MSSFHVAGTSTLGISAFIKRKANNNKLCNPRCWPLDFVLFIVERRALCFDDEKKLSLTIS